MSCWSVLIYSFKLITIDDELITEKTGSTRAASLLMCYFFFCIKVICCLSHGDYVVHPALSGLRGFLHGTITREE